MRAEYFFVQNAVILEYGLFPDLTRFVIITAWVGSVAIVLTLFTGHLSAALVTRFGYRITTLIGGAFCAMSLIASSFVENMLVLFFTYSLVFGLGSSCTFSAGPSGGN